MWFAQSSWRGLHFQPGGISDHQPCSCCCWIHLGFSSLASSKENQSLPGVHCQEGSSPAVQLKLFLALAELQNRLRAPELAGQGWVGARQGHCDSVLHSAPSPRCYLHICEPGGSAGGKSCHQSTEKGVGQLGDTTASVGVQPKSCSPERVLLAFSR